MKRYLALLLLLTSCASLPIVPSKEGLSFRSAPIVDPQYGYDFLGLGMQDCSMVAQEIDPSSTIGVLDVTFKDPRPCLTQLIATGKVISIRVHLIDGTVNNHQCSSQENINNVIAGAKRWAQFSAQHPEIKFYVSPFLEWGCKDSNLFHKAFEALGQYFNSAIPVCSSLIGGCPNGATKIEGHGNIGHADIRSNDGASLFDADSWSYRQSGNNLVLGWTNCMNGRVSGEHSTPLPPLQRKDWCTRAEVRQVVRIMREPEPKPILANCDDIKAPDINKTNAEYYGAGHDDGRGNKPLLILKNSYPRLSIQTTGGKEVGCFKYFGPYQGGGQRHYEGTCSGKSPVALMDALGGEWGKVIGNKLCLIYNSIRRQGSFH